MNTRLPRPRRQRGFTLVELMVASLVGLLLIGGVTQIYLSSRQSNRVHEALSRMQEAGRFGLEFIARDTRMADFWGCARALGQINNDLNSQTNVPYNFLDGGLDGTDGTGLNGSDAILLGGAFGAGIHVVNPYMPTVSSDLHVSQNSNLQDGDIILVSDCLAGDIFQITNTNTQNAGGTIKISVAHNTGASQSPGNATGDLSKTYDGRAQIYRVRRIQYSVQTDPATNRPTLYRQDTANAAQPLVPGIENLQIEYGEDTDGDFSPNYYVPAGSVSDMNEVVAVRISLLTVSDSDNLAQTPQTFSFNGANVTAADKRLRQVYTTTVSLRNRLP